MAALTCSYVKNSLVIPVLQALDMYSDSAVNIEMGTCAIETDMGSFRTQLGSGYAKGIMQIEPPTYDDIWRYLNRSDKVALKTKVLALVPCETIPAIQFLETESGDVLSIALSRIKYWMISEPLPPADMIAALGSYYCQFYNAGGASTTLKFVQKYQEYVTC